MAEQKHPHAGHRKRVRERYRTGGLDPFAPHEVLELLLFSFIPRADTNPLAHRLLDHFGTVENVLRADPERLKKVSGIGQKTAEGMEFPFQLQSMRIAEGFRTSPYPLGIYDIAFLANWFLPPEKGSLALLICTSDRHFVRYAELFVPAEGNFVFSLAREIVRNAKSKTYFLLIREDDDLLTPELARPLHAITAEGRAWMLDTFVLHRNRPDSILYPGQEKQWEEL